MVNGFILPAIGGSACGGNGFTVNGFILNGLVLHFVLLRTECAQHEVGLSVEGRVCPEGFTVNGFILIPPLAGERIHPERTCPEGLPRRIHRERIKLIKRMKINGCNPFNYPDGNPYGCFIR